MTEYRCHWWPLGAQPGLTPGVSVDAESTRHGAALALRQLVELGCDLTAPHSHVDVKASDGTTRTILVQEVVEWLSAPGQAAFVEREGLDVLLRAGAG